MRWWKVAALCGVAYVAGAASMAVLARRASRMYVQVARLSYAGEQHELAICAGRDGRMADAVTHFGNEADAYELSCWKDTEGTWTLGFPFGSLFLEGIDASTEPRRRVIEGSDRVVLADALERAGRREEARLELARAKELLGWTDDARVQKLVEGLTRSEAVVDEVFRRRGQDRCATVAAGRGVADDVARAAR